MGLCKMFNLWVDVHPTISKQLIVEPRDDFYSTDVLDIQSKLANDKDLIQLPMGKLDASDYDFTYKSDKDELNTRYEGQYQEVYGRRRILSQNDFVTKKKKVDVIFSPTVLSAPTGDDKVISTIIALDNTGQRKPIDHNIRILYYGGMKNCSTVWGMNGGVGGNVILNPLTQYPYAGHFSDPYNSLEDINFGLVKEVYYESQTATPITVNNNNLYNKYYSRMLAEYTDSESKIVTGWFNVNPSDFKLWTFDKLYYFENAYFRLQKIYNYNPTNSKLTKCDFLYLTDAPAFTPEDLGLDGDNPVITGPPAGTLDVGETKPTAGSKAQFFGDGNTTLGKSVTVNGTDNYVSDKSYYIDINGDGNTIESGSKNVFITGDDNTITSGFENITLINTYGVTVSESNVTYIDGIKQMENYITVNKFGEAIDCDSGVLTDIWDGADGATSTDIWVPPTTARIHAVVSTSASDSFAPAIGTQLVRIYGLVDWDTDETSEVITMNGTTPVNTVNSYVIIHRMICETWGTGGVNIGVITATAATDLTITATILARANQTQMCIYGIPSTQYLDVVEFGASMVKGAGATQRGDGEILLMIDPDTNAINNTAWTNKENFLIVEGNNPWRHDYGTDTPKRFTGPCILKIQVTANSNNTKVLGYFDAKLYNT